MSPASEGEHFLGYGDAVRRAAALPLDRDLVTTCLAPRERPGDALFWSAWEGSLQALSGKERATLAPTTGHLAESVAELILDELGFTVFGDQTGPGGHGVDLLLLDPSGERLFAVEVKGTLQSRRWPRLSRRALAQMSAPWLDKADNPGMSEWGFTSADLYGAVMLISFPQASFKLLFTADFARLRPVTESTDLDDLAWLDDTGGRAP
jgi:hypothetical protein